jgi:hypothetical protein
MNDNCENAASVEKPTVNKHVNIVIGDCKVKLNFLLKPEGSVMSDVKRIMLSGAVKI